METSRLTEALARCLDALATGQTLDECLAAYSDLAAELRPLLETALALRQVPPPTIDPAFRQRLRERLRTAPVRVRPRPLWGWPAVRWAAAAVLATGLLAGTVVSSAESLPGDPLYPTKLAVEEVQVALAPDPYTRQEARWRRADERLRELTRLADRGDAEHLVEASQRYQQALAEALASAPPAAAPDRLVRHTVVLERLLQTAPPAARPGLSRALEASQHPARLTSGRGPGPREETRSGEGPGPGRPRVQAAPTVATPTPTNEDDRRRPDPARDDRPTTPTLEPPADRADDRAPRRDDRRPQKEERPPTPTPAPTATPRPPRENEGERPSLVTPTRTPTSRGGPDRPPAATERTAPAEREEARPTVDRSDRHPGDAERRLEGRGTDVPRAGLRPGSERGLAGPARCQPEPGSDRGPCAATDHETRPRP